MTMWHTPRKVACSVPERGYDKFDIRIVAPPDPKHFEFVYVFINAHHMLLTNVGDRRHGSRENVEPSDRNFQTSFTPRVSTKTSAFSNASRAAAL